ncbi:hypothetical protein TRVL_09246 [Trypanosoma vivax]|nr:hypothetical protein TRVL_09246 [Trypanosoma vivax]
MRPLALNETREDAVEGVDTAFGAVGHFWNNIRRQARNLVTDEPPEEVEVMEVPEDKGLLNDLRDMTSLTYTQRLCAFGVVFAMGVVFIFFAMLFVPTIAIFPQKFAFFLTVGNVFFLGSTTLLVGVQQQLRSLFDARRLEAGLAFVTSLIMTLVASLHWRSSILAVSFAVMQIFSAMWYALSYVPHSRRVVGFLFSSIHSATSTVVETVRKLF